MLKDKKKCSATFRYETMQRLRRKVCNLPLNDTDSNDVELFDAGDYDGRTEDRRHLEVEGGDSRFSH